MSDTDKEIDWSKTTFEGSRREQLRRWRALSVRQRLEALDEMTELAQKFSNIRRSQSVSPVDAVQEPSTGYPSGDEEARMSFDCAFKALTGFSPLSWQKRFYEEHLKESQLPAALDIPTGLGKTAVMALWLIARAEGIGLPRRLVYVVDRRAVVDQATDFAELLRKNLDEKTPNLKQALGLDSRSLPISTLRGQHVDNKEWLEDPSAPAIVVGTVDMIGSRLLFEGYGVSRKMRPYHAGLLGRDTLVVLDEAHLVPPFEKLLEAIESKPTEFSAKDFSDEQVLPAFKLLSLSATGRERAGEVFRLKGSFDSPPGQRGDLDDKIVEQRLKAKKSVTLIPLGAEKLEEALAVQAWKLTNNGTAPVRCLIYCYERKVAESTKSAIESLAKADRKQGKPATDIYEPELFVGARRVREREGVKSMLQKLGFLAGSKNSLDKPAFLIATSAGEVGVDLDADHMVCDLVAWERMVQRLGRVNRRGEGDAKVTVLIQPEAVPNKAAKAAFEKKEKDRTDKDRKAMEAHDIELKQIRAYRKPFESLENSSDGAGDASPNALRKLKERAAMDSAIAESISAATTPVPLRPALTRALVDAWSMTSLEEHTGRPEVGPWIRGWVSQEPQTTVVWRKYLPVRESSEASRKEVEAFFESAPPHASEQLETETWRVDKWLRVRSEALLRAVRYEGDIKIEGNGVSIRRRDVIALVLSPSGGLLQSLHLDDFSELNEKSNANQLDRILQKLVGAVVVIDARMGGLRVGLLDSDFNDVAETIDDGTEWLPPMMSDGAKHKPRPVVGFRIRSVSVPDSGVESNPDWRERHRFVVERNDDGVDIHCLVIDKWRGDSANENDRSASINPQLLSEHQIWTEAEARKLTAKLGLATEWTEVLAIAARLHDEGKKAPNWQRAFKAPLNSEPYAKTKGPISFALLGDYRHEFGSLPWAEKNTSFNVLAKGHQDLVLHLIAAHHGQARPIIGTKGCEDAPPSALEARAREVALRFASLQKQWGPWGLAWWEALLRAADRQASRANDERNEEQP